MIVTACACAPQRSALPTATRVDVTGTHTETLVQCERVLAPIATPASRLAEISRAAVDDATGDVLLGDFVGTRRVYRFGRDGALRASYGDEPSLIARSLLGFLPAGDGGALLFYEHAAVAYDGHGQLVQMTALPAPGLGPVWFGGQPCLYVPNERAGRGAERGVVQCLDPRTLRVVRSFHPFDPRLRTVTTVPNPPLAVIEGRLIVLEPFEAAFTTYSADGRAQSRIALARPLGHLPASSDAGANTGDALRQSVRHHVHRFAAAHASGRELLLYEQHRASRTRRFVMFDERVGRLTQLGTLRIAPTGEGSEPLATVVGSYDRGIILAVSDARRFAQVKDQVPALAHCALGDLDNPLIVFARVKSAP